VNLEAAVAHQHTNDRTHGNSSLPHFEHKYETSPTSNEICDHRRLDTERIQTTSSVARLITKPLRKTGSVAIGANLIRN